MIVSVFVVILTIVLIWLRILNIRLKKLTLRDSLTKLGNRRALFIWQEKRPLNVNSIRKLWLIDLDNFKKVNDHYGHDTGDIVLIAISKLLMTLKSPQNFIGRWGGEEFILVTDNIDSNNADQFAQMLLDKISSLPLDDDNKELFITASIGITNIKSNSKQEWESSLSKADNALYQAKANGRNCFVISNK